MKFSKVKTMALIAALVAAVAAPAQAAVPVISITEVAPWGSSNTTYKADWFELTNTGTSAVDITGWKMDDNSNLFANSVALKGVTSLAAGQSVVFIESASGNVDTTLNATFNSAWFGANVSKYLTIGNYGGSGVGLGATATGDAVNIFDATGTLVTRVDFGLSTTGKSFDNTAGLNNVAISTLSAAGVHGAFVSSNGLETGSPGTITTVPEPESFAMMLAGLGLMGFMVRRRKA